MIASGIEDQFRLRIASVGAVPKVVQDGFGPRLRIGEEVNSNATPPL